MAPKDDRKSTQSPDRGRGDEKKPSQKDIDDIPTRLDQHTDRLTRATQLGLLASRDAGELKSGLQLVVFLCSVAVGAVKGARAEYETQKAAVISGDQAKGEPLKVRVFERANLRFPDAAPLVQRIHDYASTHCLSSVAGLNRSPTDEEDKPWMLIIQFQNTPRGTQLRSLWAEPGLQPLFAKVEGSWPPVSVKASQWKPSRLYAEVCRDAGWTLPGSRRRSPGTKRRSSTPDRNSKSSRR